ncbi:MAG: rhamnulose-1-phosphate aldolase [Coriobacteriales bacterium]|jgi:rhamnulose-1-phosphate aldolase
MSVLDSDCFARFSRLCEDGFAQGWHEANAGNLSYRLREADLATCAGDFSDEDDWHELGFSVENLAGSCFLVTGAGKLMKNVPLYPEESVGIVEIDEKGAAWRLVWGLVDGGRPTSELPTHLMNHSVRVSATDGADRVIYHAHCPNVIVMSTLLPPQARVWTRALWKLMTESVLFFPQGVGVVPWMVPGGIEIAQATARLMDHHDAVVWTQHGMFVSGTDFDAAFGRMHAVEKAAGYYLAARQACGGGVPNYTISDAQLIEICKANGVEPNLDYLDDDSLI